MGGRREKCIHSLSCYIINAIRKNISIMPNEIDALVKSDDFFALLASKIDAFTEEIEQQNTLHHLTPELQRMVDDLLYLQQTYSITKK